jgi:hypothetical protein
VTHLQSCVVEELIGVIAYEHDLEPALILLKPVNRPWQKFFLDVGAGFWEQWPDLNIVDFCADDAYQYIDYAERLKVRGAIILEISCAPVVALTEWGSRILIRFSTGVLTLSPEDPGDMESGAVVVFSAC